MGLWSFGCQLFELFGFKGFCDLLAFGFCFRSFWYLCVLGICVTRIRSKKPAPWLVTDCAPSFIRLMEDISEVNIVFCPCKMDGFGRQRLRFGRTCVESTHKNVRNLKIQPKIPPSSKHCKTHVFFLFLNLLRYLRSS